MLNLATRSVVLPILAFVALVVACGGNDGGATFVAGGPVDCGRLADGSYTYSFGVVFDFQDSGVGETVVPGPGTFRFEQTRDGEFEDSDSVSVTGLNTDGVNDTAIATVLDDGRAWEFSDISGWRESQVGEDGGLSLIHYLPFDVCEAVVPDVDTAAEGSTESVNDIRSERFDLGTITSDFLDRIPAIGPGHDAATLIPELDISVWIAYDGSYLSKVTATGSGTYSDGDTITVTLEFEVTEFGADVNVEPPIS